MRIIDNKAIELKTKYPDRITTIIPNSRLVDWDGRVGTVLVHWTMDTVRVLHNLGFTKVPSTIRKDYTWPGIYTPFDHQRATSEFLVANKRAYVFNEQGTGKTSAAAWAIDYLMTKHIVRRALIICPLSIMKSAWQNDLFKTTMHRSVGIAHGSTEQRKKVIESDVDIVIINFDGIEIVLDTLIKSDFNLVVIDEATAIKRDTTDRWKAVNQLVKPDTWLWQMTGTPAAQSPVDAYGLVKLMHPEKVDRTAYQFKDRVMYKVSTFTWKPKREANEYIHRLMQPAIRFTKDECLDLPEILYQTREVPLTKQQQKYYDTLAKEMLITLSDESITSVNAAVNMNKLLQVASGAVYTDTGEVIDFDSKTRFEELVNIIEESSHSVLVFCAFKHTIATLEAKLTKKNYIVDSVHGGVSLNKRSDIFKRFQESGQKQILLIQPQSASHGVTLHAANTIVWWSPTTSYETYAQANARVHRAGQKNPCTVVNIEGCSVEKKLYRALQERESNQFDLLGLYKDILNG